MNNQLNHYTSIEPDFFQELEGEFGIKITGKLANFLRTVEIVRPDRFMTSEMKWCGVGRKKLDREKFFRAFLLKAEFNLPTTKVLIESLKTNTSWQAVHLPDAAGISYRSRRRASAQAIRPAGTLTGHNHRCERHKHTSYPYNPTSSCKEPERDSVS